MAYCCVPRCTSSSKRKVPGISFHEIPADEALRDQWLKVSSRDNWSPNTTSCYSTVCSRHFVASDFKEGCKTRRLQRGAVPSVFFEYPSYLEPQKKVERSDTAARKREASAWNGPPAPKKRAVEGQVDPTVGSNATRSATTHSDLMLRAHELSVQTQVVHNASILTAVGCCGLQLYNFGETVSIVMWTGTWRQRSYYDKIAANRKRGLHTLCLLVSHDVERIRFACCGQWRLQVQCFAFISLSLVVDTFYNFLITQFLEGDHIDVSINEIFQLDTGPLTTQLPLPADALLRCSRQDPLGKVGVCVYELEALMPRVAAIICSAMYRSNFVSQPVSTFSRRSCIPR
ncbi:hypothetical protein HPB49_008148 [Dermacentor silvarum]|uniref:Uncharacterized protein n=1 Tax=Dermacentor silvarum TaxID=543639 RepID=A0ACB8CQX9_DERSI|nr:hypothetical protein HPB49_008148 [Dermacentor silvarum]